jgi:heat shock protein HslJ
MKPVLSFLVLCLSLAACVSSKNIDGDLAGNWELSVFPTTDKTFDEIFGQRRPELRFDVDNKMVSGSTGCNQIRGSYTSKNESLSFSEHFITTKMACPGYEESMFLDAFSKVNRFDLIGGQLRLMHDSTLVMSFVKKQ